MGSQMKKMANFLIKVSYFVFFTSVSNTLYPNLPYGKYKVIYRAVWQCDSKLEYDIQLNWYLNKMSANSTEFKGNMTNFIVIDDSLDLEFYSANKGSIGGWSDYIVLLKVPKLCTASKLYGGTVFKKILISAGINATDCPILPGTYVSLGIDTNILTQETNIPKIFFYGSYKFKLVALKRKKIVACIAVIVDIKRPWEMY